MWSRSERESRKRLSEVKEYMLNLLQIISETQLSKNTTNSFFPIETSTNAISTADDSTTNSFETETKSI